MFYLKFLTLFHISQSQSFILQKKKKNCEI